jgi:hypothetical protein
LRWRSVVRASVGFVVVVFSELFHVIESWIVEQEGVEESFDLALRGGFFHLEFDLAICKASGGSVN